MKLAVVVQARTGSSRLPGKVLLPLAGEPLLVRMLERLQAARTPCTLVVATTTGAEDDPVSELCATRGILCYRGHPTDLLDRHYRAASMVGADMVAKIPSDCPLIDPGVVDRVLGHAASLPDTFDFVSNLHPATYPDGNDVEVLPFRVLETAWREATRDYEREHTTPFIWEQPHRFRIANVEWETGLDYSMTHRWTIDYAEDYEFIKRVYDELWSPRHPVFSLNEILSLLERSPEMAVINARYAGVNWYRKHLGELRTIRPDQTREPGLTQQNG
jgi:spore coat polysaccharide biosynthesis protein SpsF